MPWGDQETDVMWNWPSQSQQSTAAGNPPNWWERNQDWVMAGASALMDVGAGLYSNRQNRKAEERAAALQKEFAQHGVRWRVEDAKAAGLHPLYALGGQLPAFSPSFSTDSVGPAISAAGQNISRAISAQQSASERAANALSLKLLESQIKETDARAGLARAEALRVLRESPPSFPPVNMPESDLIPETASTAGGAVLKAPEINMSRPESSAIVAGPRNPSLREYSLPGGFRMMLPDANNVGEALEPLSESWALAWGVYKENVRLYGQEWRREFLRRYAPDWLQMALGVYKDREFKRFEKEGPAEAGKAMDRLIDEMR